MEWTLESALSYVRCIPKGDLDDEIQRVKHLMVHYTKVKNPDAHSNVARLFNAMIKVKQKRESTVSYPREERFPE